MNTDFVRLIVAIVACVAAVLFVVRINDDWPRMSTGWKMSRVSLCGLVGVYAYGPIELMAVEPPVPLGLRIWFALVLLLGLIVGLFMVRHEYGLHSGWIKASDIQDILDKVEDAHNDPCDNPGCLIARDEMRTELKKARRVTASSM